LRGRPIRGRGLASSGVLRHSDLRTSLISKRTIPFSRSKEYMSKEYLKKIKQARMRINEGSSKKDDNDDELLTPRSNSEEKLEDDAEILDVANDINFDEEEEDKKSEMESKKGEEVEKTAIDKASAGGSTPEKKDKAESEGNDVNEDVDDSYDLKCLHCHMRCSSLNVSLATKPNLIHENNKHVITRRISDFT
jgi:hypothetical protein